VWWLGYGRCGGGSTIPIGAVHAFSLGKDADDKSLGATGAFTNLGKHVFVHCGENDQAKLFA